MTDARTRANSQNPNIVTDDSWADLRSTRDGAPVVQPWLTALTIEGKSYQVKLGNITTPLTGDVALTDAKAEACIDSAVGSVIIPLNVHVKLEAIVGTIPIEMAAKSDQAISTSGAAFIPLPLRIGGSAASNVARVAAAGGVTVPVELATTTRRHYSTGVALMGNFHFAAKEYKTPPILVGPAVYYLQVAAVGTGPSYFAHFDFVELSASDLV